MQCYSHGNNLTILLTVRARVYCCADGMAVINKAAVQGAANICTSIAQHFIQKMQPMRQVSRCTM